MNTSNKNEVADLLIVGAGVAGSAVALACASKLQRVVILHGGEDRAGVESLSPDACQKLKRYSVEVGVPFSAVLAWWGSDRVTSSMCSGARVVQREELANHIRARATEVEAMVRCKMIARLKQNDGMWEVTYWDGNGNVNTIAARNLC